MKSSQEATGDDELARQTPLTSHRVPRVCDHRLALGTRSEFLGKQDVSFFLMDCFVIVGPVN